METRKLIDEEINKDNVGIYLKHLDNLYKNIRLLLSDKDSNAWMEKLLEYLNFKDKIKSIKLVHIIDITDDKIRESIRKIINDDILYDIDKVLRDLGRKGSKSIYSDELINQLAQEHFYSWFSGYDYICGLIETDMLLVKYKIPKELEKYISECRSCLAFQQYNAVYSMCRTILETAMRDVGIRIKKIPRTVNEHEFYKEYPPRKLINSVSSGKIRSRIHDMYSELSSLIHGHYTVDRLKAKNTLEETLKIVEVLYKRVND